MDKFTLANAIYYKPMQKFQQSSLNYFYQT